MTDRSAMFRRLRLPIAAGCLVAMVAGAGIAGAVAINGSGPVQTVYVSVDPQRVLDARVGIGVAGAGKIEATTLSFADSTVVPLDATAVVLNITATEGTDDSYLSVQPSGADAWVSNVNFSAGDTVANQVTVSLAGNAVDIMNAVGQVHVVADLSGYYVEAPAPGGDGGEVSYGYIYNLSAQVVALEADVNFDTNGPLVGFAHAPGTSQFVADNAGTYVVDFSVSGVEPGQFALFQNGAPVAGAIYGSGAGTQPDNGQVIVVVAAGDVLTLRNHTSYAAVTLQTLAGGTQVNVNASILVQQLGSTPVVG